jgi:hypothetical protein
MSASENIETVKKGYAAFSAGDVETAMNNWDDNIEWVAPGNSAMSGTYRGKAEVMGLLAKVAEKSFTTAPSRFLADGDVVVVLTQVTGGGESAPQADVWTIRDGKAVKYQGLGDTALQDQIWGTK